jgi:peptidoglycan hydrolase-like protein with peptidoglycan-binding domain
MNTSNVTQNSVTLNWTAPGDDGTAGAATQYDIRYFYTPLNESNWGLATQALNEPVPSTGGAAQSYTVAGLATNATYYFAIRAIDEAGNASTLSNVVSGTTVATNYPTQTTTTTAGMAELQAMIQQLLAQVAQLQAQLSSAQGNTAVQFRFQNPLYLGLKNDDVRQLQMFLTSQGTAIYPETKITGYYGLLTRKAVIKFQLKYNIISSEYGPGAGLVGIKTRAKINEMIGK